MSHIRILAAGLTVAMLAACGGIPNEQAVPDKVVFVGGRLTTIVSNGMQCHSNGIVGSASGTFEHCPVPVRYDVQMRQQTWLPAGLAEPYADIVVTMPSGHSKLFKTPESRNWPGRFRDERD